jgi:acyl-CoA thioesterase FadM
VFAWRGAEPMAEVLVQAACVRREDFKPTPLPEALVAQPSA